MNTLCPRCWGSKRDASSGVPCSYCSTTGVVPDDLLSEHFALSELWNSEVAVRQHIANDPPGIFKNHLALVAKKLLEPIRQQFGPTSINSGYRSAAVNAALSGSSKTSAHMKAWAADIGHAGTASRKEIVDWLIGSGIDYDQVIFEGTWVHVGLFGPDGVTQRRQALMMFTGSDGRPGYSAYDPKDPRVDL